MTIDRIMKIAQVCHEANRAYCASIGDSSQQPWEYAPEWQKQSAANGVLNIVLHPDTTPEQSHRSWLREKELAGWKHGPVKDEAEKEHPCFVSYEALPPEQRMKDELFVAVARALIGREKAEEPEHADRT